jgi:hypothetical protein
VLQGKQNFPVLFKHTRLEKGWRTFLLSFVNGRKKPPVSFPAVRIALKLASGYGHEKVPGSVKLTLWSVSVMVTCEYVAYSSTRS